MEQKSRSPLQRRKERRWREEGLQRRGRQGKGSNFEKRSRHICDGMRNRIRDILVPFLTLGATRIELAARHIPEITCRVQDYLGPKVVGGGSTSIQRLNSKEVPRVSVLSRLYVMQVPEAFVFCAFEATSLIAVPLFSVVDGAARLGPASLPYLVSRLETANVRLLSA